MSVKKNSIGSPARRCCVAAWVAVAVSIISLFGTVLAVCRAKHYYIAAKLVALEPVHGSVYRTANRQLRSFDVPILVIFGDSRAKAWSPPPVVGRCFVVNRGIGGETTAQMVHRFKADVLSLAPQALIIQGGINDIVAASLADEDSDKYVQGTIANLRWMVGKATDAGIPVLLLTVIPPSKPSFLRRLVWSNSIAVVVASVNRNLLSLHAPPMIRVIDTGSVLAVEEGQLKSLVAADELHINSRGYSLLNHAVEGMLPCGKG